MSEHGSIDRHNRRRHPRRAAIASHRVAWRRRILYDTPPNPTRSLQAHHTTHLRRRRRRRRRTRGTVNPACVWMLVMAPTDFATILCHTHRVRKRHSMHLAGVSRKLCDERSAFTSLLIQFNYEILTVHI